MHLNLKYTKMTKEKEIRNVEKESINLRKNCFQTFLSLNFFKDHGIIDFILFLNDSINSNLI